MDTAPQVTAELKPMSLSEILDRTFTLYRNNFWLFCGLMALPEVANALISIIYFATVGSKMMIAPRPNPQNPFEALAGMQSALGGALVLLFFHAIFYSTALGAVTLAVSEIYLGRTTSIRASYSSVIRRMPGLFGLILVLLMLLFVFVFAGVIAGLIPAAVLAGALTAVSSRAGAPGVLVGVLVVVLVLVLMLSGVVLGIWLMMRFAVSIPAFMLERLGVFDSMGRSGSLTKGFRWRIFVSVVVMYVVVYAVQLLFGMPFVVMTMARVGKGVLPLWLQAGTAVSAAVAGTLAGPLLMITIALIYYDVRIRKEAFDLEAMMGALGSLAPQPGYAGGAPPPNLGG
ncbi:MAG TPA: hypothetical protein VKR82_17210 [Candidatus Acidoferrales bacterium]|nr:hypothetical protein [Candidatus Acidoferrales bacterium]